MSQPRHHPVFLSRHSRSLDSTAEEEPEEPEEPKIPTGTNTGDGKKKQRSGKKKKGGKGNKGKKKGREASEKDRADLQLLLDGFKGTRRLMVRTFRLFSTPLPVCVDLTGAVPPSGDLHPQQRRNAVHTAEGGEREAPLPAGHQEDHRGNPRGRRRAHAAAPPAR